MTAYRIFQGHTTRLKISAEVRAEYRMARRAPPAPRPTCGCTTAGVRCTEAHRLRDDFALAVIEQNTHEQRAMRTLYGQHLRQAGVTPGQAQWEEGV